jgi:hypothetical protein
LRTRPDLVTRVPGAEPGGGAGRFPFFVALDAVVVVLLAPAFGVPPFGVPAIRRRR